MESLDATFKAARVAARKINSYPVGKINLMLNSLADAIEADIDNILVANARDLNRMNPEDPKYDRLKLTEMRLRDIAGDMRSVSELPSPLGVVMDTFTRPNGMKIEKVTVPFGVIGVIYEARPNVTFDVFSLCVKSGSACLLKGGSDAQSTNEYAVALIRRILTEHGWDENTVTLLPASHDATAEMLNAVKYVDLIIPRGSKRLIDFVRDNSRVPVIETGAGVCHTYVHTSGNIDYATAIVLNAKTRRISVCNSLDTLIIDRSRINDLSSICSPLSDHSVVIYADENAYNELNGKYPYLERAKDGDFGREWLDYKMSIKTVDGVNEAIDFIETFGSRHSECIIAEDRDVIAKFQQEVDAACVYVNVSTAFTDGGQFGFGAEIGISTQKLHARGPMALPEIVTYKYLISGTGQTR